MTISATWTPLIETFLEYNTRLNLSSIRDVQGVYRKHILDSLVIENLKKASDILQPGKRAIDIGTGGGFPLLPLAIQYPKIQWHGVDARRKKIHAIQNMCQQLGIQAQFHRSRIEDLQKQHKRAYHLITARAVAYVDKLLPWAQHLLAPGGHMILYKLDSAQERKDLLLLLAQYNWSLVEEYNYTLPQDTTPRKLYHITKL